MAQWGSSDSAAEKASERVAHAVTIFLRGSVTLVPRETSEGELLTWFHVKRLGGLSVRFT
jgi:hypothetical protein